MWNYSRTVLLLKMDLVFADIHDIMSMRLYDIGVVRQVSAWNSYSVVHNLEWVLRPEWTAVVSVNSSSCNITTYQLRLKHTTVSTLYLHCMAYGKLLVCHLHTHAVIDMVTTVNTHCLCHTLIIVMLELLCHHQGLCHVPVTFPL